MKKEAEVLVVGGGPAGLLAAIRAARMGVRVTVAERNGVLGKKLSITGKGRCNITNTGDVADFILQYGEQGRFLYSAFSRFFHQDIRQLLTEAGLETKEERGGRVFPLSDQAADVTAALERTLLREGVELLRGCRVQSLILAPDRAANRVLGVTLRDPWDQSEIRAGAVVVATGGMSYPLTGSTGDGYGWAKAAGHRVTAIRPALVPLETGDTWVAELTGLSLRNVKASLWATSPDSGKAYQEAALQGELMFAHFGLTGPVILSLSRYVREDLLPPVTIRIDLKPALSPETLDKRLLRDFAKYQKKQLANAMADLLPRALIPYVIRFAGLEESLPIAELTRAGRQAIGRVLKALPVDITGTKPMEEAIVTAGGVDVSEVDPKTMASRKAAGLYFAGELLDIDGLTGGYNLQAAFSTGWIAGESAAKQCLAMRETAMSGSGKQ
ncbi:MAG: NAD(P)/FAD-dependent oxidoreductase [Clostridiales bacterium]|nr:NAD(P)/FAD-dependent oxidoreductase [Clostridiales bacterium]